MQFESSKINAVCNFPTCWCDKCFLLTVYRLTLQRVRAQQCTHIALQSIKFQLSANETIEYKFYHTTCSAIICSPTYTLCSLLQIIGVCIISKRLHFKSTQTNRNDIFFSEKSHKIDEQKQEMMQCICTPMWWVKRRRFQRLCVPIFFCSIYALFVVLFVQALRATLS